MVSTPVAYTNCPQGFQECYISRNNANLHWQDEGRLMNFPNSIGRRQADKLLSCKRGTLQEKGRMSPRAELQWHRGWQGPITGPQGRASGHRGLFSGLETQRNLSCWIWNLLGTGDPLSLPISLFYNGMSILCLPHHCIWGAESLFY